MCHNTLVNLLFFSRKCHNFNDSLLDFDYFYMIQPEFRYGAAASILLTVFMRIQSPSRIACSFSRIAYEWFLVHGICLSIAMRVTQSPVRLGLLGAILSLFVATGLRCCFAALSRFRQHWIAGIADETLHPDPAALGSPAM